MANWVRCFLFWVLTWFQNWDIWISWPLRLSLVTLQKCWKHLKFRPYFIVWTPKLQRFLTSWKITWSAGFALPHFSQSQVSASGEEGSMQLLSISCINLAGGSDCRIHTCWIVIRRIVVCWIVIRRIVACRIVVCWIVVCRIRDALHTAPEYQTFSRQIHCWVV